MEQLVLNKEEKIEMQDCVAYLLQHCSCLEKSNDERKFCLDVAKKALFLYNLYPKAFGRNREARNSSLKAIKERIKKYSSIKEFHI
jgi:hypothetical protein